MVTDRGALGGHGQSHSRTHGRGQRVRQPLPAEPGRVQQMQQAALLQQTDRPARTGPRDGAQLPHPGREPRGLGVDHAGRGLLPQAVPRAVGRGESAAQQVGQALFQLLGPARDALGTALRPLPGGGVGGAPRGVAARGGPALLRRASASSLDPRRGPVGRLARPERGVVGGPEQQQPQRVLARELPARATAGVGRAGGVDHRPVRRAPAPFAQAPHRARSIAARVRPRAGRAEPRTGLA